jgi:Mrp family chromosome partitioning ATPase
MIDVKQTVNARLNGNGQASNKSDRNFQEEYRHHAPEFGAAPNTNFDSFQNIAEQTLRDHKRQQTTAMTLTDESAAMFRALPLVKSEVEKIRSEILVLQQRHGTLSLGFASAHNGEGTSTILANLILDLKKTNLRVLVMDLNLRHPNLPRLFSLPNMSGWVDLIGGRRRLTDVIRVIKANQIFLLPLGKPSKTTSVEMEIAVRAITKAKNISKYFDLILFDLPPLNEVPSALYAACQTDGLIQIVQAERTRVDVLRVLKSKLEQLGVQVFGIVLNQRRFYIPQLLYENL